MHTVDKLQEVNMSPAWMPVLDLQYQSIIFFINIDMDLSQDQFFGPYCFLLML